jgi:hypothetical protein
MTIEKGMALAGGKPMLTPNPARGEVVVPLAGSPRRLCLTLGALARIEAILDLDDWSALPERFGRLSARELLAVLAALLEGGGEDPAVLDAAPVSVPEAVAAVAAALAACA